jgi:hypothetical protein
MKQQKCWRHTAHYGASSEGWLGFSGESAELIMLGPWASSPTAAIRFSGFRSSLATRSATSPNAPYKARCQDSAIGVLDLWTGVPAEPPSCPLGYQALRSRLLL